MDKQTMYEIFRDGPISHSKATRGTDASKADIDAALEAGQLEEVEVDGKTLLQLAPNTRASLHARYGALERDAAYAAKYGKFG